MTTLLGITNKVKIIDRVLLATAITCITISSIITLNFGDNLTLNNEEYSTLIWFSVIGSIFVCILSFLIIAISAIIYRNGKFKIWAALNTEIILTIVLIAGVIFFHICTMIVYD